MCKLTAYGGQLPFNGLTDERDELTRFGGFILFSSSLFHSVVYISTPLCLNYFQEKESFQLGVYNQDWKEKATAAHPILYVFSSSCKPSAADLPM